MIAAVLTYAFNIYFLFWCEFFCFSNHYSWNVDFVLYMADVNYKQIHHNHNKVNELSAMGFLVLCSHHCY